MFTPTDAERLLEGQKHGLYPVTVESLIVNGQCARMGREIAPVNITEHLNVGS